MLERTYFVVLQLLNFKLFFAKHSYNTIEIKKFFHENLDFLR